MPPCQASGAMPLACARTSRSSQVIGPALGLLQRVDEVRRRSCPPAGGTRAGGSVPTIGKGAKGGHSGLSAIAAEGQGRLKDLVEDDDLADPARRSQQVADLDAAQGWAAVPGVTPV